MSPVQVLQVQSRFYKSSPVQLLQHVHAVRVKFQRNFWLYFMSRNKQSQKYLIGRSNKNDEFDWPFDFVTVN